MNRRFAFRTTALLAVSLLGTAALHAQGAPGSAASGKIGVVDVRQAIVATGEGKQASAELQSQFPMLDRLVKVGMDLGVDERTARYRVCQFYVLEWGWRLFGPHLLVACGLADEPEGRPLDELRVVERSLANLPPVDPL